MAVVDRPARVRSRTRRSSGGSPYKYEVFLANGTSLGANQGPAAMRFAIHEKITDYPRPKPLPKKNPRSGSPTSTQHLPRPLLPSEIRDLADEKKRKQDGKAELLLDRGSSMYLQRHSRQWHSGRYSYDSYHKSPVGNRHVVTQGMYMDLTNYAGYDPRTKLTLPTWQPNFALWGPKAWNSMLPTKRPWDFIQSLVELRDIPKLTGSIMRSSKSGVIHSIASEYLNHKFGWESLLEDLAKLVSAFRTLLKRYEFLQANNGLPVRRKSRRIFHDVTNSSTGYPKGSYLLPKLNTSLYPGFTTTSETRVDHVRTEEAYYASGKFIYHLPSLPPDSWALLDSLDYSLGVTLRLKYRQFHTLWKVWPFSWLVDWFGNLGTLIENAATIADDSVVAQYAYVSYHKKVVTEVTAFGPWGQGGYIDTQEVRAREQASPYGFGLSLDSLSPTRKAILIALGAVIFAKF